MSQCALLGAPSIHRFSLLRGTDLPLRGLQPIARQIQRQDYAVMNQVVDGCGGGERVPLLNELEEATDLLNREGRVEPIQRYSWFHNVSKRVETYFFSAKIRIIRFVSQHPFSAVTRPSPYGFLF